jgi:DNA-binding response OmpR family regulator
MHAMAQPRLRPVSPFVGEARRLVPAVETATNRPLTEVFLEETKTGTPHWRVLMVGDDEPTQLRMAGFFKENQLDVQTASARDALAIRFAAEAPSLLILDLHQGNANRFDLLREIRLQTDLPIIAIGAEHSDEADRVIGLELGADDFVMKPLSVREVLARVRAVLRRHSPIAQPKPCERGRFRFDGWQMDSRYRRLKAPGGTSVPLTNSEYALLMAFLKAPQRPLTRLHLLHATRVHEDALDRSIDVQILRLRRKLEVDPSNPRIILTIRGVGYVFALPVAQF